MKSERGKLFVFEGVDAAGKTTLCNELCKIISNMQLPVRQLHFPGKKNGTLGELVYRIHHSHNSEFGVQTITPCSLQLLHIAAHIDNIESEIKPALNRGEWVVLDRFWWSTCIYGLDAGVQELQIRDMINVEKQAWGTIIPNIVFLVDSEVPLRPDEANSIAWQRKRQAYNQLAASESGIQKCVRLETHKGIDTKVNAIAIIRDAVDALR